ncbi:MAG: hypothetical protein JW928_06315, partial [Candidatus Aureabacteria bacterium]|nr:hypothetical protein [Candidatus Auribacterota bacterium]
MYIQCPHCKQQIDITESGKAACSLCHKLFEAFLFIPSQRETVIRPEAALSSEEFKEARCYLHAENKAHHICERCGSFICEICLTEIET